MTVRIFKPSKNAMQSGKGKTKSWVLEYEKQDSQYTEPLMHWTGNTNTRAQVRLNFPSKEAAIDFAEDQGWTYIINDPHPTKTKSKNYADNFVKKV